MFKFIAIATFTFALTFAAMPNATIAAPPGYGRHHHHDVHVDYCLHGWRSKHFHDHHAAHDLADFLRSVGCRVRIEHDFGHYDVMYTCPQERMRWFHEDRDAHRFTNDLRRLGFTARVHH